MDFDVMTIIAFAVALLIGCLIYYAYNKYNKEAVDKVFGMLKSIWENYGKLIEKDNPALYKELEVAMETMEQAMSDEEISIMEAYDIAQKLVPLVKRLEKYIKDKYEN